jgi:hypothetical protein
MGEVNAGVELLAIDAGRQHLVAQSKYGFQEAGGARCPFQVADVGFHRTERDRAHRQIE